MSDDLQPLQPYAKHPDPYSDLRRDYARVCAERDALRWERNQQHTLLIELRQALADLPIRHTFSLPCATRYYTGLIPPACTCGAAGLDAERMALITKIDTLFVG